MCFKNNPGQCGNSTAAEGWRSLVTATLKALDAAITEHGLNVEIILDGDAVPAQVCLEQLWRPHNATYISFSNPAGAFYESNVSLGWDRFAILNENVETFDLAALLKFGKFAEQERYGYLVWEPSDQPSIEHFADSYLGVEVAHVPAGFRFAINIDSTQWRVYSASRTGTAWSDAVLPGSKFSAVLSVTVPVQLSSAIDVQDLAATALPLPDIVGMPQDAVVITFARLNMSSGATLVYAANAAGSLGGRLGSGEAPVPAYAEPSPVPIPDTWAEPDAVATATTGSVEGNSVCLGTAAGSKAVLSCFTATVSAPATVKLSPATMQLVAPFQATETVLSTRAVPCGAAGIAPASAGACGVALVASSATQGTLILHVALLDSAGGTSSRVVVGTIPGTAAEGGVDLAPSGTGPTGMLGAVVVSSGGAVYSRGIGVLPGGVVCVGTSACNASATASATASLPSELQKTHVGSSADVTAITTKAGVVVADTHTDGFCQNSETHNKQPFPATCVFAQQGATSTPNVMNYNVGTWEDWAKQAEGMDPAGPMQSPCSERVLAGSFAMGSGRPSPWLFAGQAPAPPGMSPASTVALAITHDGLPANAQDTGGCGIARAQDGVVVDGFSFPPFAGFA